MASLKKSDLDVDSDEEEVPELQAQEASEAVVEAPVVTDLSNPEVVNKYQEAAKIAQLTLQNVISKVKSESSSSFSWNFLDSLKSRQSVN